MIGIGVLVSGRGSNLRAILEAVRNGRIKGAEVRVVVSNRPGVPALDVAREFGVPVVVVDDSEFKGGSRWDYDRLVLEELERHGVKPGEGLVLLAGFMRILSREFVELWSGRIMNIHPSLLPAFPGLRAQRQALEYGVKYTGCTVHFVTHEVDAGPIILQAVVEVRDDDTEESLAERILKKEHEIYPEAVRLFVEGRLKVEGRRVKILA